MAIELEMPRARHGLKRKFYIAASGLMAAIALVGFWPTYFGSLANLSVQKSAVIHFHAAVMVGWLALFVTQVALAATGHVRSHRRLGQIGIGYGVLVILVGLTTTFYQFAGRIHDVGLEGSLDYPTWPLVDMILFAPFFALAVAYRRRPEIHKRLMIVATTTLLVAAALRMGLPWPLMLAVWFSPILIGIAYDLVRQRLIHPVYLIGLAVLFVSSFRDALMDTDVWLGLTRWLGAFLVG